MIGFVWRMFLRRVMLCVLLMLLLRSGWLGVRGGLAMHASVIALDYYFDFDFVLLLLDFLLLDFHFLLEGIS